jgi:RNA-directed DNA polymerase
MRRHGHLFDRIVSEAALLAAYAQASRNKRAHRATFRFARNLGGQIHQLLDELQSGRYRPHPCNRFVVNERKKARLIEAPAFRDLVVQHAIYAVVAPLLDRRYVDTSFACRIGKGTHKAADWLQAALRRAPRTSWTLHVDVRKFFYSIDRSTLEVLLRRVIKCERTLRLMMLFAQRPEPRGVPIGNLLSQTFANVYLNSLDHFCKRELKVHDYARYMDDSVMIAPDRQTGLLWLDRITRHLGLLGLEVSHYSLQPIKRGVNFVGYRTWARARFVRPSLITAIRSDARRGRMDALISRLGCARRTCSISPLLTYLKEHHHAVFDRLPQAYRFHVHPRAAAA